MSIQMRGAEVAKAMKEKLIREREELNAFKTRYPSLSTENEPFLVYRMPCDVWMQKKPFPFKAKS